MVKPLKIFFFFMICIWFCQLGPELSEGWAMQEKFNDYQKAEPDLFEGFIYFADSRGAYLKSVKKFFPSPPDDHVLARQIIEKMIQGPAAENLNPTWPGKAEVNTIFIADDNTAYVDMTVEPEMVRDMDSRDEMLAVYSMVNSLTVNIPKIKRVKILIKGRDAQTLAGHVNLEYYYKTNMLIVK